ncbi:tolloid-like protein 1 [Orbicella faveolata]|uniref:tolloid-like protein 1 n=1 Tax=Orbicella faveolata TaxID=48498 RepID=UPI0009E5F2A7|nr:tolloid-like protein 1 [Orbicella faveolata]XP_020628104.1 tolloid-like protein 1 [Orbicella faveolata]
MLSCSLMFRSMLCLLLSFLLFGTVVVLAGEEDYDPCKADGIIQGDIAISLKELRLRRQKRAATAYSKRLWRDGVIPFVIADGTYTGDQKATIIQAMRHWENFTCLSFVERTIEKDYIYFHKGRCGCCSYVGRKGNGRQGISVGKNCDKFGIVVHEIGHTVGFWHEHTRPDRGEFVTIVKDNIKKGEEHNFLQLSSTEINSLNEPYDYGSIMHYGKSTFAKEVSQVTILPKKDPETELIPEIGQRDQLSQGDIRQTSKMYRCAECGRTLQDRSGTFTSPGFPRSQKYKLCEWRISMTPGERISLNFTIFGLRRGSNKCKDEYVEIRDGHFKSSPLIGKYCGKRTPPAIWSTGSRLWIKYSSGDVVGRLGFKASYKAVCGGKITTPQGTIQSPKFPAWYPPNKKCTWTISLPENFRVGIRFVAFDVESHSKCLYDYLQIYDGPDDSSTVMGRYCGKLLPEELKSNFSQMTIQFSSDGTINKPGFYLNFFSETDECRNNNGGCAQICEDTVGGHRCSCQPGYELKSNNRDCEAACGGTLTAPEGNITSPSYPDNYPKNKRCIWKITGPKGQRISLKFLAFQLEGNGYGVCRYDFVEVKDKDDQVLGKFCGGKIPQTVTSTSNLMWVEFRSDHTQSRGGFSAVYYADEDECQNKNGGCEDKCVNTVGSYICSCREGFVLQKDKHSCKEVNDCGATLTTLSGEITSPNYPGSYQGDRDCTWKIIVPPGNHVQLEFRDIDIEGGVKCRYDFVEVFSGTGQQAESLGRYCGMQRPNTLTSRAHKMMIKFGSDSMIAKKGFRVRYTAVCGAQLHSSTNKRQFSSHPSYGDDNYKSNLQCWWLLTARSGYIIRLRFKEFDVENEKLCGYDYVIIRDGNNSTAPLLGRVCGQGSPGSSREFVTSGNRMWIQFRTDLTNNKKGFVAEYSRSRKTEKSSL